MSNKRLIIENWYKFTEGREDPDMLVDAHKATEVLVELRTSLQQMEMILASEWAQVNWVGYSAEEQPNMSAIQMIIDTLKEQIEQLEINMSADKHQSDQR